jgi:hypothetical protein
VEAVVFSARPPDWWKALLVGVPIGSFVAIMFAMSLFLAAGELDNPARELPLSLAWLPAAQVVATAALILCVLAYQVAQIRLAAPERNFLRIDETGLTFTRFGKSRTWAWPEISPFERDHSFVPRIRFLLPNLDPEQARRDRWVHEMTPAGATVVIPDVYDTQLDKIISQLNVSRARALGERPDPGGAGAARPSSAAAAMPPVTFGERPSRKWLALAMWLPLSLLCGAVTIILAKGLLSPGGFSDSRAPWLLAIAIFAMVGTLVATMMVVATLLFRSSLRLDEVGLTYVRRQADRHWYWSEFSAFECDSSGVPRIRFHLPDLDPEQARRDPWVQEVTPAGAMVVVRDIYDAPLDEITAKLNEYREQTLAAAPDPA